jgi:hypothetical protein
LKKPHKSALKKQKSTSALGTISIDMGNRGLDNTPKTSTFKPGTTKKEKPTIGINAPAGDPKILHVTSNSHSPSMKPLIIGIQDMSAPSMQPLPPRQQVYTTQAQSRTIDLSASKAERKKFVASKSPIREGFRLPYDDSYALDVLVERPN